MKKLEDVIRQGSCKILWRKLRLRRSLLLVLIQIFGGGVGLVAYLSLSGSGREVGWGGRLFEAGHLLTFSAFRMGAYSRWAPIRGWALIRINTVFVIIGILDIVLIEQRSCYNCWIVVLYKGCCCYSFVLFFCYYCQ